MTNEVLKIAVRKFGPFESALQKIWDAYCQETGCDIRAEMVPMDLHPLHEALIVKKGLLHGDWDIAHLNTDWLYEAHASESLLNLKSYIERNPPADFPQGWSNSLLDMQQIEDGIFGLPFHDGPECLIYRKDLFEDPQEKQNYFKQFGLELEPPKSWEDFHRIARFFYRPADNLYGCIFACFPDGHNAVFDFCLQLWSRGGSLTDPEGRVNIRTPEAAEALSFYREIVRDKTAVHPGSEGFESVNAGLAFARGEAAMMINWFGFASMCEVAEESNIKGKVDVTHIPASVTPASLNVYWLYTIGSGSRHKELAYDFIRFAINQKNDKLLTLEGGIGCRVSTWKDPQVNTIVPYYHKLEMLHQHAKTLPLKSSWPKIMAVIDKMVGRALKTDISSEELLAESQSEIGAVETKIN